MIIALGHKKQQGKDTLGAYLVEHHGFVRLAFADRLKQITLAAHPRWRATAFQGPSKELIDPHYGYSPRVALQRVGEGMRGLLGDDIWINIVVDQIAAHPRVVVTDLRYPNEADRLRQLGATLVEVHRHYPKNPTGPELHSSECALDGYDYDYRIDNTGPTPDNAYSQIERLAK